MIDLCETFFSGHELTLSEITRGVIDRATEVRAHFNVKTPDAIHLASAVESGASVFLTGDTQLSRCTLIPIELI